MNKNFLKVIFSIVSFVIISAPMIIDNRLSKEIFGLKVLNNSQYNQFISDKTYQYNTEIQLYLNEKIQLTYITDLYSYLLSTNLNNLNGIELTDYLTDYQMLLVLNDPLEHYIKTNGPLIICIYNKDYYDVREIRLTTLPTMFITTNDNLESSMSLINPSNERNLYELSLSEIVYDVRGSFTIAMAKHHYRMTLKDGDKNVKFPLLNMRNDDDWILNSFVIDESLSIEPLALEIRNNLCPEYKHELRHLELVINGMYQGIYGLMERVDFKTFKADKQEDLFIKVNTWQSNIVDSMVFHDIRFEDFHEPIKDVCLIDEFEVDNCTKENFDEIIKVLQEIHTMPNSNILVDFSSFAAHELFVGLTCAEDNTYKNQRILAKNIDGKWKLNKSNWDNDLSFTNYNLDYFTPFVDLSIPSYVHDDPLYLNTKANLYLEIKKVFNKAYLINFLETIRTNVEGSGAVIRDSNLWHEIYSTDFETEFNRLYNTFPKYVDAITGYYDAYFS